MVSRKYETEQAQLSGRIEEIDASLAEKETSDNGVTDFFSLIAGYADAAELSAAMVNALIEKITVGERVQKEDGTVEQTIKIYYKFVGVLSNKLHIKVTKRYAAPSPPGGASAAEWSLRPVPGRQSIVSPAPRRYKFGRVQKAHGADVPPPEKRHSRWIVRKVCPSDLQQREGRIIRQGNENNEVDIYTYVTENTFDSYLYQMVDNKQKFIGQIMTSKSPVRSAEDIDETVLSYAEIKALCAGDERIKEKMDLDVDVQRLKLLKSNHLSQKYTLEDQILKYFPCGIAVAKGKIRSIQEDMATRDENTHPNADGFSPMVVNGVTYTEKKVAGSAILAAIQTLKGTDPIQLGQYRGFAMELRFDAMFKSYDLTLIGSRRNGISLGTDLYGNIQRIDNMLDYFETELKNEETHLLNYEAQLASAKVEVEKPFPQEDELKRKSARLDELNIALNLDKQESEIVDGDVGDETDTPARDSGQRDR